MKAKVLTAALVLLSAITIGNAQNNYRSVRIGASFIDNSIFVENNTVYHNSAPKFSTLLGVSGDVFKINNRLNLGAYLSLGKACSKEANSTTPLLYPTVGVHYGIDLSYSLLDNAERWDLRLGSRIGSYFFMQMGANLEYGAGFSAAYYPLEHFGLYGSCMWGKFLSGSHAHSIIYKGSTKLEFGLNYRF